MYAIVSECSIQKQESMYFLEVGIQREEGYIKRGELRWKKVVVVGGGRS